MASHHCNIGITLCKLSLPAVQSWSSASTCGLLGWGCSGQKQDDSESDVSLLDKKLNVMVCKHMAMHLCNNQCKSDVEN